MIVAIIDTRIEQWFREWLVVHGPLPETAATSTLTLHAQVQAISEPTDDPLVPSTLDPAPRSAAPILPADADHRGG